MEKFFEFIPLSFVISKPFPFMKFFSDLISMLSQKNEKSSIDFPITLIKILCEFKSVISGL